MKPSMVPMMVPADEARERSAQASLHPRPLVSIFSPAVPTETEASVRRRMIDLVSRMVSGQGSITRDDLLCQFDEDQIARHFRPALKAAGAHRMVAT